MLYTTPQEMSRVYGYPTGQTEPGQHPKLPNYWLSDCSDVSEMAVSQARELAKGHNGFLLHIEDNGPHINLKHNASILDALKTLRKIGYRVSIFEDKEHAQWLTWKGELSSCIVGIQVYPHA